MNAAAALLAAGKADDLAEKESRSHDIDNEQALATLERLVIVSPATRRCRAREPGTGGRVSFLEDKNHRAPQRAYRR